MWRRAVERFTKLLHVILRATVMRHDLGLVLIMIPTRDAPGVKIWGFQSTWYIPVMHVYYSDTFTPTYTINYYGVEYHFTGTLGFDAARVRKQVCSISEE